MASTNYQSPYGMAARLVSGTAACVPLLGSPSVINSAPGAVMVSDLSASGRHPFSRIAGWARTYDLTAAEMGRLAAVVEECSPAEVAEELAVELRGVLAARTLARMKLPTAEDVRAVRAAFEEGRLPVKSLPLD